MKISVVWALMSTQAMPGSCGGSGLAQPPRARASRKASGRRMAMAPEFMESSPEPAPTITRFQRCQAGRHQSRRSELARDLAVPQASSLRQIAATLLRGSSQQQMLLVVEFGPGAEAMAAGHQAIACAGGEAVVLQGQLAVTRQRTAVGADVGTVDLEAVAHVQRAAAGLDLEIAVIIQAATIHRQRLQVGFLMRSELDPGMRRVGLGNTQRTDCETRNELDKNETAHGRASTREFRMEVARPGLQPTAPPR